MWICLKCGITLERDVDTCPACGQYRSVPLDVAPAEQVLSGGGLEKEEGRPATAPRTRQGVRRPFIKSLFGKLFLVPFVATLICASIFNAITVLLDSNLRALPVTTFIAFCGVMCLVSIGEAIVVGLLISGIVNTIDNLGYWAHTVKRRLGGYRAMPKSGSAIPNPQSAPSTDYRSISNDQSIPPRGNLP
jgi:hypothetical protein